MRHIFPNCKLQNLSQIMLIKGGVELVWLSQPSIIPRAGSPDGFKVVLADAVGARGRRPRLYLLSSPQLYLPFLGFFSPQVLIMWLLRWPHRASNSQPPKLLVAPAVGHLLPDAFISVTVRTLIGPVGLICPSLK